MAKVKARVALAERAMPVAVAPHETISEMYSRIKGRELTHEQWGDIASVLHMNDLSIYYGCKNHNETKGMFREVMVFADRDGYVAWHILSLGHVKEWTQDTPHPTFRVLQLDHCETAEQSFADACHYLAHEKPEIYLSPEERAELDENALFKVEFNGDWLIITDNMRAKYTFWQIQDDDLQLVVKKDFDSIEEAKQCVRGQIASALEDKLSQC